MISLKDLVQKFSVFEGRQPRVMVCRPASYQDDADINKLAVELAGQGFDVDIGVPFDSVPQLGMNALENDSDILILIEPGLEEVEFVENLNRFLIKNGQSGILILSKSQEISISSIRSEIHNWLSKNLL